MATKEKRHPSALTLAHSAAMQKSPIYGHFQASASGNTPGSLPAGLPAPLPYQLPEAAAIPERRKPARAPLALGRRMRAGAWPAQPGPFLPQPGLFLSPPGADSGPLHGKLSSELGTPLGIRQVAQLIGCSPWTVRQTLMPRGLPFFRSAASGRLIFYTNQIVGWIEKQQGGIRHK
jgi:hypothetical protein